MVLEHSVERHKLEKLAEKTVNEKEYLIAVDINSFDVSQFVRVEKLRKGDSGLVLRLLPYYWSRGRTVCECAMYLKLFIN